LLCKIDLLQEMKMPVLHMQTESVRSTGRIFNQSIASVEEQKQTIMNAVQNLSTQWKGDSYDIFNSEIQTILQRLNDVASKGRELSVRLEKEVDEWLSVDSNGSGVAQGAASNVQSPPAQSEDSSSKDTSSEQNKGEAQAKYDDLLRKYNGHQHASGTNKKPWQPIDAPVKSQVGNRDSKLYEATINQFGVESNPRYQQNQQAKGETYCNIFAWDVSRAMGAEIPHWVDTNGNPTAVGAGKELSANGAIKWLQKYGEQKGWQTMGAADAQGMANQGKPVIAAWLNPEGIGHMGVVRPGEYLPQEGPRLAQAGGTNFNDGFVKDGFGNRQVIYYVHE
jgi:uncharacterized protein YukE